MTPREWAVVVELVDAWVEVQAEALGREILARPPAWRGLTAAA